MRKISIHLPYITQEIVIFNNKTHSYLTNFLLTRNYNKILVLIDTNVFDILGEEYLHILESFDYKLVKLDPIGFSKDVDYLSSILKSIYNSGFSRNSVIICIGGGFVGDLGGFLAGMYMRGIDFIQIGTTLMAQSDAIIGKVGINVLHKKNIIGLFYSPILTICDIHNLLTLSYQELHLATIEIIKHELINKDSDTNICFYRLKKIEKILMDGIGVNNSNDWIEIIDNSLLIKKDHVENDPYDKNGYHKGLSLGHTIGNVMETMNLGMRHGDAIWIGIYISLFFSSYKYPENKNIFMKIRQFMSKIHDFKYKHIKLNFIEIIDILKKDKISDGSKINFVILENIGKFNMIDDLPYNIIKDGFEDIFIIE